MKYEILLIIGIAIIAAIFGFAFIKDVRHAFTVPEGYAGLLYHKGRFVKVLGAGRHIRWGRHFTLDARDLRKASLLVCWKAIRS